MARRTGLTALAALALALPGTPLQAQDTGDVVRLSLHDAVTAAADTTPVVVLARLGTAEAIGQLQQARSVFFPTLSGSVGFVRQTENLKSFGFSFPLPPGSAPLPERIGPFDVWDFRPALTQTLFSPAGWVAAGAARARVTASAAGAETAGEAAAAAAAAAYIDVARARAALAARVADDTLARALVQEAQAELAAGVGTRLDVVRASTRESRAGAAVESARTALAQAQIALARSLGLPTGTQFALVDTLRPGLGRSAAPESASAIALALARRPELAAAQAARSAARLARRATGLERLGRLQLAGDYGRNGPALDDMIATGRLALQYSIPVFQGFRLRGELQQQAAQSREADVRLADLHDQVTGEVRSALAALTSGLAQQDMAAQQLSLAEEELAEARLRFASGVSGNIDVITAQGDLVQARTALVDALAQTALARVGLARAAGVATTIQ